MYLFKATLNSVSGYTLYPSYRMTKWQAFQLIFNALFSLTMFKSAARLHTEGFELRSTSCFQHLVLFVEFMMYKPTAEPMYLNIYSITAVKFKWSAVWSIFGVIKTEGHHPLFIHHYLAPVPTATGWKAGINPPQVTSPLHTPFTHATIWSLNRITQKFSFLDCGRRPD